MFLCSANNLDYMSLPPGFIHNLIRLHRFQPPLLPLSFLKYKNAVKLTADGLCCARLKVLAGHTPQMSNTHLYAQNETRKYEISV